MTAQLDRTIVSPSASPCAASLSDVCKSYKHFGLKRVNFTMQCGTVAGLIGPNGAGKSTIMRLLMGLVQPDAGTVRVFDKPISSSQSSAKLEIGYFADDMRLYKPESIGWHMQFVRSLYPTWDEVYAQHLLGRFGLLDQQIVKGLSHGQRVKAMLLLVLARRPKLLILDEPTNGLDPVAKHEVLTELMQVVEDETRSILYSSHNTQDVDQICDTITFIDRGEVIAANDRDDFLQQWRRIKLQADTAWVPPALPGLRLEASFRSLRVLSVNRFTDDLSERLQASGAVIETIESMTLEEVFVSSVMRGREEQSS